MLGPLQCPREFATAAGITNRGELVTVSKRHLPVQSERGVRFCLTQHRPLQAIAGRFLDLSVALTAQHSLGMNVIEGHVECALDTQYGLRCERPPGKYVFLNRSKKCTLALNGKTTLWMPGLVFYVAGLRHQRHPQPTHRERVDANPGAHQCECTKKLTAGRRLAHEPLSEAITLREGCTWR